jgi:cyclophilin family peptidyl-prolyl cis-trans isomerase
MFASRKTWIALAILAALAGCSKRGDEAEKPNPPVAVVKDNDGKAIQAQPVSRGKVPPLLPFKDAVILDPPPEGELQPPDKTHTGKNAIKIFETIANRTWDQVNFKDSDGRPVRYEAIVATELGDIHIDLRGDLAPNHVRSFVCLARAGYYDGMAFYYSINRTVEDSTAAYIETGCPRGTGADGSGSIGYWLAPEITDTLRYQEGLLVAYQGRDPASAACRFYLTAAVLPPMDRELTIFGKVTRGLDVIRTINRREVQENDRPTQPVLIRSVTITTVPD